jgi:hypothetical protein
VEAEPRRFHFASSGMMAVGEGDHLMLHHLSTRLVGDGDGRRSRVELVGCGGRQGAMKCGRQACAWSGCSSAPIGVFF